MEQDQQNQELTKYLFLGEQPQYIPQVLEFINREDFWPKFHVQNNGDPMIAHADKLALICPPYSIIGLTNGQLTTVCLFVSLYSENSALPISYEDIILKSYQTYLDGKKANMGSGLLFVGSTNNRSTRKYYLEKIFQKFIKDGIKDIIAPIRPILKSRYPLIPLSEYAQWKDHKGQHWDPFLKEVTNISNAQVLGVSKNPLIYKGTVKQWEAWTGLTMQSSGLYIHPDAQSPIKIDMEQDLGIYEEPHIWIKY